MQNGRGHRVHMNQHETGIRGEFKMDTYCVTAGRRPHSVLLRVKLNGIA